MKIKYVKVVITTQRVVCVSEYAYFFSSGGEGKEKNYQLAKTGFIMY